MLGRILKELRDEVEFHETGNSDSMECNLTEDNQEVSLHSEVILTSTAQVESTPSTKNHPSAPLSTSDVSANDNTVSKQVHEESTDSKHTDKCTPVQPEPTDTLTSKDSPPVQPESTDTLTSKDCAPVKPESTDTMTSNNSAPVQPQSTGTVTSNDSAPVHPESTGTVTSSDSAPVQPESTGTVTSSDSAPVQPESTGTVTSNDSAPVKPEFTNTMTSNDCAPVQLESTNTSTGDKSVVLSLLPQSTGIITTPSGNNVPTPLKRPRRKVLTTGAKVNTMENYVKKLSDSPSSKRKLSDGTTSPSSTQLAKTVRSDGADILIFVMLSYISFCYTFHY